MKVMKPKAKASKPKAGPSGSRAAKATKDMRRLHKLEKRRKEKKALTADDWNAPVPSHLVAKLDVPRVKSKYQSYFEFAENSEKKEKRLEFGVTNKPPSAGYVFVPVGDPMLTNLCKELSREVGAMIMVVSTKEEDGSKISEHIYRTGYHFRETIVEQAREIIGETVISKPLTSPGFIEPIPESQDEINKQADNAIRDLFPRIPNTDRTMIIDHAFKKGALFHGEPTVGLQPGIPLSRRVQLAVLAHIRHTHTRYDKLLRETTWINARKAVEPVCLDVLIKWRGDEETGRDQMDEILREVVIITDSEGDDDDSSDDETSEDEGEITSASSAGSAEPSPRASPAQQRPPRLEQGRQQNAVLVENGIDKNAAISLRKRTKAITIPQQERKAQRGFRRYQAAWEEALHRRQDPRPVPVTDYTSRHALPAPVTTHSSTVVAHGASAYANNQASMIQISGSTGNHGRDPQARYAPIHITETESHYPQPGSAHVAGVHRSQVTMNTQHDRPVYHSYTQSRSGTTSYLVNDNPSQVVRGSPIRHGPQDIPLPSVETSTMGLSSSATDSRGLQHNGFSQLHEPHSRRVVEQRLLSPVQRQLIVIDDDSPPVKRRRVAREDIAHFGSASSHDHKFYVSNTARSDSYVISGSFAEERDFLVRRPVLSSSAQGLSRTIYIDPETAEELPIIDEHDIGRYGRHAAHARLSDDRHGPRVPNANSGMQRVEPPQKYIDLTREIMPAQRAVAQPAYVRDRTVQREDNFGTRQPSPRSRQYQPVNLRPPGADQDSIQTFSHSRIDGSASNAANGFVILSERSQRSTGLGEVRTGRQYENASATHVQDGNCVRARSPVRYMEGPVREESHLPVYHQEPQYIRQELQHTPWHDPNSATNLQHAAQYNAPVQRQYAPVTYGQYMEPRHPVPVYQ